MYYYILCFMFLRKFYNLDFVPQWCTEPQSYFRAFGQHLSVNISHTISLCCFNVGPSS